MEFAAARVHSVLFSLRTNRSEFRILVRLLQLVPQDALRDSLVAEYEARMNYKENPWTLAACVEDLNRYSKEVVSYIDITMDALPEYKIDVEEPFGNLIAGINLAKMSLEMTRGDKKFASSD